MRVLPASLIALLVLVAACDLLGTEGPPPPAADPDKAIPASLPEARLLFLHRSVGGNLVRNGQPDMYQVLDQLNQQHATSNELWHHYCGSAPYWNRYYDGNDEQVEPNFGPAINEQPSATPEHWLRLFTDPGADYAAARDSMDNFRVIAFKCGYDNTVPYAVERAAQWREQFNAMKDCDFFRDPRRRLVITGFPPIREGMLGATQADADSARAFSRWLSDVWPRGRGNLHVFPLFDLMAGPDNWLCDEYELDQPNDSHPNVLGSTEVGGVLARFLYRVANEKAPVDEPPAPQVQSTTDHRF